MFRSYWPSSSITYYSRTFWCITSVNQVKLFLALSYRRFEAIRHEYHCKRPSKKHLVKGRKSLLQRSLSRKLCKQQTKGNKLLSFTNFNAKFLYSLKICMLRYNPRHVSRINMPIFRRTNCIIIASDNVTVCKRLHNIPDESRLVCSCNTITINYGLI